MVLIWNLMLIHVRVHLLSGDWDGFVNSFFVCLAASFSSSWLWLVAAYLFNLCLFISLTSTLHSLTFAFIIIFIDNCWPRPRSTYYQCFSPCFYLFCVCIYYASHQVCWAVWSAVNLLVSLSLRLTENKYALDELQDFIMGKQIPIISRSLIIQIHIYTSVSSKVQGLIWKQCWPDIYKFPFKFCETIWKPLAYVSHRLQGKSVMTENVS